MHLDQLNFSIVNTHMNEQYKLSIVECNKNISNTWALCIEHDAPSTTSSSS